MNRTKHKIDKNEISEIVHGCAKGLYRAGFIDKTRMDKYDVMCFKTKTKYTPKQIKTLRKKYNISQAVLAMIINASISTVCKWEIGLKRPCGTSLKVLDILDKKGLAAFKNTPEKTHKEHRTAG